MVALLVTRLLPFAGPLIETLEKDGYDVYHEPLLSVEPLYYLRPDFSANGKTPLIALTSRMTLEILSSRRDEVEDLLESPCYCVGDKTAEDAKAFGFTDVISAQGDGQSLAEMILDEEMFKKPVLHIGGETLSPDPHLILESEGWPVYHWPIYRTTETEDLSEHTIDVLKKGLLDAVLFYSARTAQIFVKMIERYELETCCPRMTAIGLSRTIIDELAPLSFKEAHTTDLPTEEALIQKIHTLYPPWKAT